MAVSPGASLFASIFSSIFAEKGAFDMHSVGRDSIPLYSPSPLSVLHSCHPAVVKMPTPARSCTHSPGCPFILGHPCPLNSSGMPILTSPLVHTMAMISPSPSAAPPSLGAHSQVILSLIHHCHPSHFPSTHLFLIPASLGWYFVSCRGGRTW